MGAADHMPMDVVNRILEDMAEREHQRRWKWVMLAVLLVGEERVYVTGGSKHFRRCENPWWFEAGDEVVVSCAVDMANESVIRIIRHLDREAASLFPDELGRSETIKYAYRNDVENTI